jgi:glycosyltransferase involved in cell wall biosynthesis
MLALSVIVCTHNPLRAQLQRVLDALAAQTLPQVQWELIVIDNASDEPLAQCCAVDWHMHGRYLREDQLGLTPARLRGIAEAKGPLLVFVDDDNVLDADYLSRTAALAEAHPQIGAFGSGCLEAEYEVSPSRAVARYLGLLSRHVQMPALSDNLDDHACVPWGSGLCVRREVARTYPALLQRLGIDELLDRRGQRLFGNGDIAFSWCATLVGQRFGIFPQLRITHLIPTRRLSKAYVLRYIEDSSFSGGVFDFLRTGELPRRNGATALLRLALRALRRGPFASRVGWAAISGSKQAHAYIRQRGLQALKQRTDVA